MTRALLVLAGGLLGFASAKALFLGIMVTFAVWGLAALAIGARSAKATAAAANGALFGFPLTFAFAAFSYTGGDTAGAVPSYLLAGIVGAVACIVLSVVGSVVRRAATS